MSTTPSVSVVIVRACDRTAASVGRNGTSVASASAFRASRADPAWNRDRLLAQASIRSAVRCRSSVARSDSDSEQARRSRSKPPIVWVVSSSSRSVRSDVRAGRAVIRAQTAWCARHAVE